MPRVLRTPRAREDLSEIIFYIARESASQLTALRFIDWIDARCELHAGQPEMGERCPDLGETVRRFVVGNYVIYYQPLPDGIELLRVLHGSRDLPAAWRSRFN